MMYLAAVEHRIRRGVAAIDRVAEAMTGFLFWPTTYERGDHYDTAERLRQQLVEREEMEEVSEPDSLRCDHFDCVRCLGHDGLHESPWGDSVPWPPEADLDYDDDPFVSDSHLRYNESSAHAGADTASAGTPAAEADRPAAGVTHPAPAAGLPSPSLAETSPELLALLEQAAREWGGLGVARAAAHLIGYTAIPAGGEK